MYLYIYFHTTMKKIKKLKREESELPLLSYPVGTHINRHTLIWVIRLVKKNRTSISGLSGRYISEPEILP